MTELVPLGKPTAPVVSKDPRTDLMGMSLDDLSVYVESLGEKPFRAKQLFKWIYGKRVDDFDAMTNVSKVLRARLKEIARISRLEERVVQASRDGTKKFLWGLEDGLQVESVLIPEERRMTLCISTQVGCPIDCDFCVTGKGGYTRNLTKSEILGQIVGATLHCPEDQPLTNIVLMGMGEPLLNLDNVVETMDTAMDEDGLSLSHRKITLSTVGLIPQMKELGKRSRINLAVSLHGTTEEQRTQVMPINRKYSLEDLIQALTEYPLPPRKMVTIEYILLAGVNDSVDDAHRLAKLLRPVRSKVNLIPYNNNPFTEYKRPADRDIVAFQEALMSHGVHTVVRLNRGNDIDAACGQLGGYEQKRPKRERA
ncbi:MAG: 23S rRNA (adenine(2503)-C(2))-methyltransferase RlmN [Proteobacteria bacterium]|nr:23S rRNA (adenine(2503)-C(2))-methyltransferase RlmN [Pseudomonadota bacterium]